MPDPHATTRLAAAAPAQPGTPPRCGVSPGDLLGGRYRLGAPVGWGGQAVVFYATDTAPRPRPGPLAVKVVRTDLSAAARREAAELLRWEAGLLRRLRHAALPRLAGFASDAAGTWLARELVLGTPLTALLRQGPAPQRQVRDWAAQLCTLLRYLHTRTPPVICGDLKPANLVLRPDGTLALVDLGAAQTRTRRPPRSARPHYGTPGYAAPEQLAGRGMDERSDLFALAATCYELLTGADPALTPLVFDHARLAAAAPALAPVLRPALEADAARRPQTAAALHAALAPLPRPAPLALAPGVTVASRAELADAAGRHPQALAGALASGACEQWLADHPDPALGALLHRVRAERRAAPRAAPLHSLLTAMAPPDGSALLFPAPRLISFGDIPLRTARAWGAPRRLTIHNAGADPLRWELECPPHPAADVRVLASGRAGRRASGVLPPGGRAELDLVAAGKAGAHRGELVLRSGTFSTAIPWEGAARPGLPVGHRVLTSLAELDPAQPGIVSALEQLARRGALTRWLRAQGAAAPAAALEAAGGDALALRLAVGALLHARSPERFPLLAVGAPPPLKLAAGTRGHLTLALENRGGAPCVIRAAPGTVWARCLLSPAVVAPGAACSLTITLAPPPALAPGTHTAHVPLLAGDLPLPLAVTVEVAAEQWWQRALRWITG